MEEDFNLYLEKYCKTYGVPREEAIKHKMVQDVKKYYENLERGLE